MSEIPRECKRLAEVDFPIANVSLYSAEEKKVFGSHPSMLNQWWARRPLGACRAMLLALLLPDPADPNCPTEFKARARDVLPKSLEPMDSGDDALRDGLLRFIGDFASWDRSDDTSFVRTAVSLTRAAYGTETPLVVDPFAGGGSIPLESLRIGADCFASDLNPVACLIEKVLLEDIPSAGESFVSELQTLGNELKDYLDRHVRKLFPADPDGSKPVGYLWARTVRCEAPNCGSEIPLARSFWLCKKPGRRRALKARIERKRDRGPSVLFEIIEPKADNEATPGTVNRAKATCIACGTTLSPERVRAQLSQQRGGADPEFDKEGNRSGGARLLAVILARPNRDGRFYRLPSVADYEAVRSAQQLVQHLLRERLPNGLSVLPDEPAPIGGGTGAGRAFSNRNYGMTRWDDFFTSRQKVVLATLVKALWNSEKKEPAVRETASFLLGRLADKNASLVLWDVGRETVGHVFNRQALPMVWDFVESAFSDPAEGLFESALGILLNIVERQSCAIRTPGQVQLADARESPLPDASASIWFTDPPYYDAIPYSDLSDFFFVWLKRGLPRGSFLFDPFDRSNNLTPKTRELVQDETRLYQGRPKDARFFEEGVAMAFQEGRRVLREDGIGCVVFAHKTTEGWEALLSGIIRGGWVITGSWPIATERPGRLRSLNSAALATSIHLVCRPRPPSAPAGDWAKVVQDLPVRVRERMNRLADEGVRGADLVFACVGPAMEVYSRYSKVVDAQDREIPLGGDPTASDPHEQGFLAKVWEVVGKIALEQVLGGSGTSAALEEDSRLTALFLWAIQSSAGTISEVTMETSPDGEEDGSTTGGNGGGYALVYDVVRRFAQPLGIHLDAWEGRIVETSGGIVRLIPVQERVGQLFDSGESQRLSSGWQDVSRGRQTTLFADESGKAAPTRSSEKKPQSKATNLEVGHTDEARRFTTLDRLHRAMLLQARGAAGPLRGLLLEEKKRGPEFERLARSLTALYPKDSEERRLIEALALVVPKS